MVDKYFMSKNAKNQNPKYADIEYIDSDAVIQRFME